MRESPYEAEDVLQALIARFPSLLTGDQNSGDTRLVAAAAAEREDDGFDRRVPGDGDLVDHHRPDVATTHALSRALSTVLGSVMGRAARRPGTAAHVERPCYRDRSALR
jgi:hypothetical protein